MVWISNVLVLPAISPRTEPTPTPSNYYGICKKYVAYIGVLYTRLYGDLSRNDCECQHPRNQQDEHRSGSVAHGVVHSTRVFKF